MLRSLPISQRLYLLITVCALATAALVGTTLYSSWDLGQTAIEANGATYEGGVRDKLQVSTHAMAVSLGSLVASEPDPAAKVALIRRAVDRVRYEEDESGYFLVYRGTRVVALPPKKELVGKDLGDTVDTNGVRLVKELADAAKAGGGFVEYLWDKPGAGLTPKLTYCEPIPGTDLWIGTGAYLDNVQAEREALGARLSAMQWRAFLAVSLPVAIVLLLLLVPLTLKIARSITVPLAATRDLMRDIAEGDGDLTQRLQEDGNDELAELSAAFNTFAGRIGAMIQELAGSALSLSASATQLHDSSGRMSGHAQTMSGHSTSSSGRVSEVKSRMTVMAAASEQASNSVAQVAATSEELSATAQGLSAGTEEMSASVDSVAAALEELSASFAEVNRACQQSSEASAASSSRAKEAASAMEELDRTGREVSKIVDLINDVADQTNLLALNATIEASSAGEAGAGFIVVANEVKTLAKQTAAATGEITRQIEAMQATTRRVLGSIADVSEHADRTEALTSTIDSSVAQQVETLAEVTQNVSSSAAVVKEMSKSIAQMSEAISELAVTSSEVSAGSNEIARTVNDVASFTEDAANDIGLLIDETRETANDIHDVEGIAGDVKVQADEIDKMVAQFKY